MEFKELVKDFQYKLMLDERNNANRKLSLNKIRAYLENEDIVTEFDKDAFEILIKQVIVGGYDEKENADPQAKTFVLRNDNKINSKEYLQSSYDISKQNLQVSNHTCGVLFCFKVKVIAENTGFVTCSPVNKNSYKNGKK